MWTKNKKTKSFIAGSPCVTPVQAGTVTPAPIPIRKRSLPLPQLVTKPLGSLWEGLGSSVIACERQVFLLAHRRWESLSSDERGETSQATFVIDVTVKKDSLLVMYLHVIFPEFWRVTLVSRREIRIWKVRVRGPDSTLGCSFLSF